METDEIPNTPAENWVPITDRHTIGVLGKLAEEAGELVAAISRCLIQGMHKREPTTGKINKKWLEEEIADVEAMIQLARKELVLDNAFILKRRNRKIAYKQPWFDWLFK